MELSDRLMDATKLRTELFELSITLFRQKNVFVRKKNDS